MLRIFILILLLSTLKGTSLRRSRRSVMADRGYMGDECVGRLKLVTNTETRSFNMSMARVLVKNIARVVMEGSCCGTIYSGMNYRGKSHRINRPGEFLTRVRKAKSVVLRNC